MTTSIRLVNAPHGSTPTQHANQTASFDSLRFVGGGFISGLVAHPRVPGLYYVRTDVGGAYRRDSSHPDWHPITDFIGHRDYRYTGVESVALDPNQPDRVFLALGIYNRAEFLPSAIACSEDRGARFRLTELPFGMGGNEAGRGSGERLAVDPNHGDRLLFGSRDQGLWQSLDAARSFQQLPGFPAISTALPNPTPGRWNYLTQAVGIVFVLFDPSSGRPGELSQTVYAAVSTATESLFRSTDGGVSWHALAGQPLGLRPIRGALATNGVLYVTYGSEPGPNTMRDGAVWKFDPRDHSFRCITPLRPEPATGQTFGYASVALDARDPERVLVTTACRDHALGGGDEVFLSLDGGASFRGIAQCGQRDVGSARWLTFGHESAHVGHWMYALSFDPFDRNTAYYATGQTLWACHNLTAVEALARPEWRVSAEGIEETVPLCLISPPRGADVLVGTGDISGFAVFDAEDATRTSALFEPTFKDTSGLDFAEQDPELIVRVGSRGWNRQRDLHTGAFSLDGGRSFVPFASYPEPGAGLGRIAVSADGCAWLWLTGSGTAYVSVDRSASWTACADAPKGGRLVADRVAPTRFYAIADGVCHRSDDAGRSFQVLAAEAALPRRVDDLCAVFGQAGQLWAALEGRLFRSVDGGVGWREVPGLSRVSHVSVGRALSGYPTLYLAGERGAEQGFFASTDEGRTFRRLNRDDQKFGEIRAIAGDPKRFGRFYIATGGRGALRGDWTLDAP